MIVNMPAVNGCQSLATTLCSTSGTTTITSPTTQEPADVCDFNFLKRKLEIEHNGSVHHADIHSDTTLLEAYQDCSNHNSWKKRHLDDVNTFGIAANFHSNALGDFIGDNALTAVNDHSSHASPSTASIATTLSHVNNSDMSFTTTNAFINDLFTYDANLLVPVSASLVSNTALCGVSATVPSTGVCLHTVNYDGAADEDGANWQATDLLELDHRYNSGLQTEITQLNPTINLKPSQEDNLMAAEHQAQHERQQQQSPVSPVSFEQQQHPQTNFIVPQKQMSRTNNASYSSIKYRQHQPHQHHQQHQQQEDQHQQTSLATQSDSESDFEDKNLSWLLNFKFDEFPHLSPDVGAPTRGSSKQQSSSSPIASGKSQSATTSAPSSAVSTASSGQNDCVRSPKNHSSSKAGKKFEELVMEVTSELDGTDVAAAETVVVEDSSIRAPKKPPFTYTELIEYALEDKGELTVSGIYQWISDRFPYYKSNDDRWKNSVRHNLSINPHFRKGLKAPQGAGHLWTISSGDSAENVLAWEHKKQRLDLFFKMESMNRERLQQHKLQQQQQQQREQVQQQQQQQHQQQQQQQCASPHNHHHQQQPQEIRQQDQCLYDEAAAAAATIAQEMSQATHNPLCPHDDPHLGAPYNDMLSDDELRKTAGQILNGIHRDVEVQSVNSIISTYQDVLLDNAEDYLNPINKDINLMHPQSHISGSHYYVTEIDPLELGIQMSHQVAGVEEEVLFNDEFNLNYFYNPGNDIVA